MHALIKLCLSLWGTEGTEACQTPLFMGFPRQEYWSELLFSSSGDLLIPGVESTSPGLAGRFFTTESQGKPQMAQYFLLNAITETWSERTEKLLPKKICISQDMYSVSHLN